MSLTPASALLTDRFVVVTGAAQGIGAAVAGACARFGADVAICDRDTEGLTRTAAEVEAAGRRAATATLDVRDGDAVREWIGTLERVDVLVNNAGGGFRADFLDVNEKGEDSLVRENFTSVTNFVRARRSADARRRSRVDHQHHVDRGAPRRSGIRDLQRDEGGAR